MVPNENELEVMDVIPKTSTYTKKLARNLKGRSLLSSVTARVFRLGQKPGDSTHHEHETTKTLSQTTTTTQDCHLNGPKTTTGSPSHHYFKNQSRSVLDSSSSGVKSSIQDRQENTASVTTGTTVTTNTSSSSSTSASTSKQPHCRPRDNKSRREPSARRKASRQSIATRFKANSKAEMPPESKSVEGEGVTMSLASSPTTTAALTECAAR
jgi:hypothetical protein